MALRRRHAVYLKDERATASSSEVRLLTKQDVYYVMLVDPTLGTQTKYNTSSLSTIRVDIKGYRFQSVVLSRWNWP